MRRIFIVCLLLLAVIISASGCIQLNPSATPSASNTPQPASTAAQTSAPTPAPTEATVSTQAPEPTPQQTQAPENTEQTVLKRSAEVLTAIKNNDYNALSTFVHPEKGLRFTPYAYVENKNLVFKANEISNLSADSKTYHWGDFDGTGEPIDLSFADYYKKFIYDVDFLSAPQTSYNNRLGMGNSLDNSREYYPNAAVTEYYFPGFEEKYGGMDWRSLRLVFEKLNDTWYLVGVIHDQWTI